MSVDERPESSRTGELMVSLWLVAVLFAEALLLWWFLARLYST